MPDQVEVTARHLDTGDTSTLRVSDSYVLTLAGSARLADIAQPEPGVHVLTIIGAAPVSVPHEIQAIDGALRMLPFPPEPT